MIILDIMDVLDILSDEQRELVIAALLKQLTIFSHYTILEAQLLWDGSDTYANFITHQNEIIRECIKIELSFYGTVLRRHQGMEPLTNRTEINL